MELYLQMGHGMEKMCLDLLSDWGNGTVIFSPVNVRRDKLKQLSQKYRNAGGKVLFDPQMYYPKDGADKLKQYDYWPSETVTISDYLVKRNICSEIYKINTEVDAEMIILPGQEMDKDTFSSGIEWHRASAEYFRDHTEKPIIATLCLYTEVLRSSDTIEQLVALLANLDVDGYYIVARSSNEEYIISDTNWMIGLTKLITCLKLMNKYVLLGYTNHQGLISAISHIDAIASGNFMNTRQFVPDRFRSKKSDLDRRKSNWYFHPYAITEYKADLLDVAYSRHYLDSFAPLGEFRNAYSKMLFDGAMPSSTNYNEPNAFKHYLHCMKVLCNSLTLNTYDDTKEYFNFLLDNAENKIQFYKTKGLRSQNRDFGAGIEALRIASVSVDEDYGFRLRIDWNSL